MVDGEYIYTPEICSDDYTYKVSTYSLGIMNSIQILSLIKCSSHKQLIMDIEESDQIPWYAIDGTEYSPPKVGKMMVKMISDSPENRALVDVMETLKDDLLFACLQKKI